jgi:Protein of unknown function (DUF3093)
MFVATALVVPASLLVFLPINVLVGIVAAILLYLGCVILLIAGSPAIEVTDTTFIAGRARLPLSAVGNVEAFFGSEAQLELGQRLDARAWLLIRGWVSPVVKIQLTDPKDPTPYWVVSTRHPEKVRDALAKAKAS